MQCSARNFVKPGHGIHHDLTIVCVTAILVMMTKRSATSGMRVERLSFSDRRTREHEGTMSPTSRWKALLQSYAPFPRGRSGSSSASPDRGFHLLANVLNTSTMRTDDAANRSDNSSNSTVGNNSNSSESAAAAELERKREEERQALIRDNERRQRLETLDPEGQVVSGSSRAWLHFLQRIRSHFNTTAHPLAWYLRPDVPFEVRSAEGDKVMKTAPYAQEAGASGGSCSCLEGERVTSPSCGSGGDRTWRVNGFWFLYSNAGCAPCQTCLAGEFVSKPCDGTTKEDTTECAKCTECVAGEFQTGTACSGTDDEDTQTCAPCPEGSYCLGGNAEPLTCKTTCDPGYMLAGECVEGSSADNTTCAECPEGFYCVDGTSMPCKSCAEGEYMSGDWCESGSASDTQTCEACAVCGAGQHISGPECSGNTTTDTQRDTCVECLESSADAPACPAGHFLAGPECQGDGFADSRVCKACTACAQGEYQAGTPCDGTGTSDTSRCQPCTRCKEGEYMSGTVCAGDGSHDTQTCTACTTCPKGLAAVGPKCDGNSTEDLSCWTASEAGESCNYACDTDFMQCMHEFPPLDDKQVADVFSELGLACDEVKEVAEEDMYEDAPMAPFLQIPAWDDDSSKEGMCLYSAQPSENEGEAHSCGLKKERAVRLCACVPSDTDGNAPFDDFKSGINSMLNLPA